MARGRFSSRVMQHWIAPGKARPDIVALSYLNAGLRLFDISDPTEPKEVAYFVPPRDGEMDDYMSWRRGTTRGGLHRMGSQPDLAIDPCWRLLSVGTVPRYAGA